MLFLYIKLYQLAQYATIYHDNYPKHKRYPDPCIISTVLNVSDQIQTGSCTKKKNDSKVK
jgi:hypothetical protein